jgi:hypothetical protein
MRTESDSCYTRFHPAEWPYHFRSRLFQDCSWSSHQVCGFIVEVIKPCSSLELGPDDITGRNKAQQARSAPRESTLSNHLSWSKIRLSEILENAFNSTERGIFDQPWPICRPGMRWRGVGRHYCASFPKLRMRNSEAKESWRSESGSGSR